MCGRGACALDPNALRRICNAKKFLNVDKTYPSYNICPGNFIPVLLMQDAMLKYYASLSSDNKDKNKNKNKKAIKEEIEGAIDRLSVSVDERDDIDMNDKDKKNKKKRKKQNVSIGDKQKQSQSQSSPRIISAMKWGLIPSFAKEPKMMFRTINARSETVTQKPMYRRLVNTKRCVVLFQGYYEWKRTKTSNFLSMVSNIFFMRILQTLLHH